MGCCQLCLLQIICNVSDLNNAALKRKITLCHELLDILNVLQPGSSQARGTLLLELQEAMLVQTKRELASEIVTKEAAQVTNNTVYHIPNIDRRVFLIKISI